MNAADKNAALAVGLMKRTSKCIDFADARTLRLAALALHRWHALRCGVDANGGTAYVEQDENTGLWARVWHGHVFGQWQSLRTPQPDLEALALARVANVCERAGLHYYQQTDPRGWPLYIGREPLDCQSYATSGYAVRPW